MKNYITVKEIKATEMTRGQYNVYRGWKLPKEENPFDEGYLIIDVNNNHKTWQPKKVFESTNIVSENKSELFETISLMCSENYNDRFKAEYLQLKTRYLRLMIMLYKWDKGLLDFKPKVNKKVYETQLQSMIEYMTVLQMRSVMEGVDIGDSGV